CKAVKSSMAAAQLEICEKEERAVSLAKYTVDLSNKFTHQRGAFTVCLYGGSLINYLQLVSSSFPFH
ncbi:6-phosphogluconolactonase, partial [Trifolium medium]|nr:6-phosphogluconolactonase [Trifolium medium]